jgi:hypothetical protein
MQKTAKDLGTSGRDNAYGYGLVQAKAALDYLKGSTPPPSTATTATVTSVTYSTQGGRGQGRDLGITVTVKDNLGTAVANATVSVNVYLGGTLVGSASNTTGSGGTTSFVIRNAPSGTYTTTITGVNAAGLTWDGKTPPNSFTKP